MEHHAAAIPDPMKTPNPNPSPNPNPNPSRTFDTLTRVAVMVACVMPAVLFSFSHFHFYSIQDPSDAKEPITILPINGATLWPILALITYKAMGANWGLPFLIRPVKLLLLVPLLWLTFTNFLACVYGNINTKAFTDSIVIDVVAGPEYFNIENLARLQSTYASEFEVSWNITQWKDSIQTAAFSYSPDMNCGPRTFVRFMSHKVGGGSALSDLVGVGAIFQGAWIMVDGKKGSKWHNRPRLFTIEVGGNDILNWVLSAIWVDYVNHYHKYDYTQFDSGNLTFDNPTTSGKQTSMIWTLGDDVPVQRFKMDQYSCMVEASYMSYWYGKRPCFHKKMDMQRILQAQGQVMDPILAAPLTFPSGNESDCSTPMVRAFMLRGLAWHRENYYCDSA